jgi:hypothetical protein
VEGANIVIEYRWAEAKYERLPGLVAELIRSNVERAYLQTSDCTSRPLEIIPVCTISDAIGAFLQRSVCIEKI